MTDQEILKHIDHTLLSPTATWEQIKQICDDAVEFQTASICIPASYVAKVKREYADKVNICTVIGFPLGHNTTESKVAEAKQALKDGASEVDMVINITDVKNGLYDNVLEEIKQIKAVVGDKILKVIIEACYLTEEEKVKMCEIITQAGADFIKTSTGFGTGGATMEDILLFKEHIGKNVRMKAAGGVRTREDLVAFISAGCDRIGTSSAVKILAGEKTKGY